jgi:hypothetical protein
MEVRDTCEEVYPAARITVTPLGSRVTEPIGDHRKGMLVSRSHIADVYETTKALTAPASDLGVGQ